MDKFQQELSPQDLDREATLSLVTELTDAAPRPILPPAVNPLAQKLGRLLTNPRVTGDFFQTVLAVRHGVNREIPPKQIAADARFLLQWFGRPQPTESAAPPPPTPVLERGMLDTAARALALERSIASAQAHNLADPLGLPADVVLMAQAFRALE